MSVYSALANDPRLDGVPLHSVSTAKRFLRVLKNDIILVQPSSVPVDVAPPILPPTMVLFIQASLGIAKEAVEHLWDLTRDEIWDLPLPTLALDEHELFRLHGWKLGFMPFKLYPPTQTCVTTGCDKFGHALKKADKSQAVVYTLSGVYPAFQMHLTCQSCGAAFHNNFAVKGGTRTYYHSTVPDYMQVGEHQFVERKLAGLWVSLMFRGWVSATNCARTYEIALAGPNVEHMAQFGWQFGTRLTTEHVWDAFLVLTLLEHRLRTGTILAVPHGGDQEARFRDAMAELNSEVVNYGTNAVGHCCDKCLRENVLQRNGKTGDVQVIVGDGLSIGRPICGFTHCPKPLSNIRHRFCDDHKDEENICSVSGCRRPILPNTKSCDNPDHQGMEKLHYTHISASTTLGERLQRHRQRYQPADVQARDPEVEYSVDKAGKLKIHVGQHAGTVGISDEAIAANEQEIATMEAASMSDASNRASETSLPNTDPACEATKSSKGKKFKAKYNTSRSHTEFFLSYPCGIIVSRATMLNAEAVSNALLMVQASFSVPGAVKPEHFIYDSNCDASQQVQAHPEQWEWFADMGMSVDVFHFLTKHSETHYHCQQFCNPASFRELLLEDGASWYFNSSIAEQNNAWLGGFQSIVRQMTAVKYDFFLNEMVRLHNEALLAELKEKANARIRI
ncbi:hypothetical protein MKEN_01158100 [Mycena kentingensis (nom. inval.)]|nr:hypothetical protein MKEN_01158100 [Mycena kentingensis (nom. inval.)]